VSVPVIANGGIEVNMKKKFLINLMILISSFVYVRMYVFCSIRIVRLMNGIQIDMGGCREMYEADWMQRSDEL
jgi:hypothetical protein